MIPSYRQRSRDTHQVRQAPPSRQLHVCNSLSLSPNLVPQSFCFLYSLLQATLLPTSQEIEAKFVECHWGEGLTWSHHLKAGMKTQITFNCAPEMISSPHSPGNAEIVWQNMIWKAKSYWEFLTTFQTKPQMLRIKDKRYAWGYRNKRCLLPSLKKCQQMSPWWQAFDQCGQWKSESNGLFLIACTILEKTRNAYGEGTFVIGLVKPSNTWYLWMNCLYVRTCSILVIHINSFNLHNSFVVRYEV